MIAEYNAFFKSDKDGNDIENQLYKLQLYNNVGQITGTFFNSRKKCEICDKEHKDNCDFSIVKDTAYLGALLK